MNTCSKCGNNYRDDVAVCPNDGTALNVEPSKTAPPPAAGPPAAGPPVTRPPTNAGPKTVQPPRSSPKPASKSWEHELPAARTGGMGGWIFAFAACLVLLGGFWYARGILVPAKEQAELTAADESAGEDQKSRKKKRSKKKRRRGSSRPDERAENFDDYDWEQDFVADDLVLGDIRSEREAPSERVEVIEPPPYEPTRTEWQPEGKYRPVASYKEPGFDNEVVEIDLSRTTSDAPMDESAVRAVLDERRLMPCYERWVQKIPQMRGAVSMKFTVAPDGHVAAVSITQSELRSRVVEKCIVAEARRFRFPRSSGNKTTRFSTRFDFTNR